MKSGDREQDTLLSMTSQKLKDKQFRFGSQFSFDPRSQSEDLGDDPVKAAEYGIANLKRIVPQLRAWTDTPANDYQLLSAVYTAVINQFITYIRQVATYAIRGRYETIKSTSDSGPVYQPLEKGLKQRCV